MTFGITNFKACSWSLPHIIFTYNLHQSPHIRVIGRLNPPDNGLKSKSNQLSGSISPDPCTWVYPDMCRPSKLGSEIDLLGFIGHFRFYFIGFGLRWIWPFYYLLPSLQCASVCQNDNVDAKIRTTPTDPFPCPSNSYTGQQERGMFSCGVWSSFNFKVGPIHGLARDYAGPI